MLYNLLNYMIICMELKIAYAPLSCWLIIQEFKQEMLQYVTNAPEGPL